MMKRPETWYCLFIQAIICCILQRFICYSYIVTPSSQRRYLSTKLELPPLEPISSVAEVSQLKPVSVVYTNDPAQVSLWLSLNVPSAGCILGFDMEAAPELPWTRPCFVGPSVVQLAVKNNVLVVHLVHENGLFNGACLPLLDGVFRDENIVKAGCGLDMDFIQLCSIWRTCEARTRLDLGRVFETYQTPGLKTLTARILGLNLPKQRSVTQSDWSQFPLSAEQVSYAAYDAWVGAALCDTLAYREPEKFSRENLVETLQSQVSVRDLHRRRGTRKRAKFVLRCLLETYDKRPVRSGNVPPRWKRRLIRELNAIIRANKHYQPDDDIVLRSSCESNYPSP